MTSSICSSAQNTSGFHKIPKQNSSRLSLRMSIRLKTPASCAKYHSMMPTAAYRTFLVALFEPVLVLLAWAGEPPKIVFQTTSRPVALLELYTSEGCSSCPPAESWLSRLKSSPRLWTDFVPLAFHVDYWDNEAWRDPWSSKEFTGRQRIYAGIWRSPTIYTPEFVLHGKEWRDWRKAKDGPKSWGLGAGTVSVSSGDGKRWRARFVPSLVVQSEYRIEAALLAFDAVSEVKGGENRGRTLHHDFVVTAMTSATLMKEGAQWIGAFTLEETGAVQTGRRALAAWITRQGTLEPLQAVGGWLPRMAVQP
jgi:hypothetical protein